MVVQAIPALRVAIVVAVPALDCLSGWIQLWTVRLLNTEEIQIRLQHKLLCRPDLLLHSKPAISLAVDPDGFLDIRFHVLGCPQEWLVPTS